MQEPLPIAQAPLPVRWRGSRKLLRRGAAQLRPCTARRSHGTTWSAAKGAAILFVRDYFFGTEFFGFLTPPKPFESNTAQSVKNTVKQYQTAPKASIES